jgi:hypothetical protein
MLPSLRRPLALLAALLPGHVARAQAPDQAAIAITAVGATSPPSMTFTWPLDPGATGYSMVRRHPGSSAWTPSVAIPGGGAAVSWTDTHFALGERYELWFSKTGAVDGRSFVTVGIEAAAIEQRGVLVLLVDASKAAGLGARLDRLIADLVGDG